MPRRRPADVVAVNVLPSFTIADVTLEIHRQLGWRVEGQLVLVFSQSLTVQLYPNVVLKHIPGLEKNDTPQRIEDIEESEMKDPRVTAQTLWQPQHRDAPASGKRILSGQIRLRSLRLVRIEEARHKHRALEANEEFMDATWEARSPSRTPGLMKYITGWLEGINVPQPRRPANWALKKHRPLLPTFPASAA